MVNVIDQLRSDVALTKKKRDDYVVGWQRNVNERRGKGFDTAADEGRSMVPMDWTLTKTKAAQLFSQMPQVRLSPKHEQYSAAVPVFAKIVNDLLKQANVEAVMSECVVDCINASGIAAAIVRYEALAERVPVASEDPIAASIAATVAPPAPIPPPQEAPPAEGTPAETAGTGGTRVTSRRFIVDRISPADLLWPLAFRLSDWNKAPWLGHSSRGQWARVKRLLNLSDEQKEQVCGASRRDAKTLASMTEDERKSQEDLVDYDELFYWRYLYHDDEKYYDAIQRVVFVVGIEEPVIDEPWKGQQFDEQNGGYIGSCLLPIRILTLNYISDEAIPPSDSAIIRPQVKELQESRNHMREQRKMSRPLQWFDVDRVDPAMTADLVKGTWQGMIPTIGPGDKVIGEVARASYPRENLEFDRQLKQDIQEAVSVGPNQSGMYASGERSAQEAAIVQQSFQTEIGQQRAKTANFLVGIADVLAGLWAIFGVIEPNGIGAALGPEAEQRLHGWDRKRINQKFIADVRVDSMVRLDAQQLLQQITSVLNVTAQSGFINPKALIKRIVELNGIDPAEVLVDPQPKGPEPPKISYSFKGEDLANPIVLAIIDKSGQGPGPQDIEAAKAQLEAIFAPPAPPAAGGGPALKPTQTPGAEVEGMPSSPEDLVTNPETPDTPFPAWESAARINTRRAEG